MTSRNTSNKIVPNQVIRPTLTVQEAQFLKYCLIQATVRGFGIEWAEPLGQLLANDLTRRVTILLEDYLAEESN